MHFAREGYFHILSTVVGDADRAGARTARGVGRLRHGRVLTGGPGPCRTG